MNPFAPWSSAALVVLALAGACGTSSSFPGTSTTSSGVGGVGGVGGGGTGGAGGAAGSGGVGGTMPPPVPLRVLTWNTHNFFDSINDNPQGMVLSANDYKQKRATIGGVIHELSPDVAMLEEVENQNILDDLNKAELGSVYSSITLIKGNDPRGINIGLLSKITPDQVVSHKDEYFAKLGTNGPNYAYARDCLEVHLTVNGRTIVLLGVHFRAKGQTDDPDKRLAEAQHTRAIADGLVAKDPSLAVIVLGDFNDVPGSPPMLAVAGKAPSVFADAATSAPEAERYSYDYNGTRMLIDHQMGNPAAVSMLDPSTVVLKHGSGVDDDSTYASDHAPLFAVYQVR